MKSQTKALLASVMVLALALSSIGGVTYSWFSDTQTIDVNISTGKVKIDKSVDVITVSGSESGITTSGTTDSFNVGLSLTGLTSPGEYVICINVENLSDFPVEVSGQLVVTRHQAVYVTKNESGAITNISGVGEVLPGYETGWKAETSESSTEYSGWYVDRVFNSSFWSAMNGLQLDGDEGLSGPWGKMREFTNPVTFTYTDNSTKTYNAIRDWTYSYDLQDNPILQRHLEDDNYIDDEGFLTLRMEMGSSFDLYAMTDMKIVISCIQSNPYVVSIPEENKTEASVIDGKSISFIGQGFSVEIPREALDNAKKVAITVSKDQKITVKLRFTDESGATVDPNSNHDISFTFDDGQVRILTVAPASNGIYTLYSVSTSIGEGQN